MGTTPLNGWRYPAATAAPDVPGDIYALASDIEADTGRFTNWTSFLPNGSTTGIGNFGGGSSTVNFFWRYIAGEVEIRGQIMLGTGGGCGNDPFFDLPVPANTAIGTFDLIGQATFLKGGGSTYVGGIVGFSSTTRVFVRYANTPSGGGAATMAVLNATTPFTWNTNDVLFVRLRYTAA